MSCIIFLTAKKRSLHEVNEHFEPYFDAVSASAVVFQQPARHNCTRFFSHMPHHNTLAIDMDCMLGIHYNLITFRGLYANTFTPMPGVHSSKFHQKLNGSPGLAAVFEQRNFALPCQESSPIRMRNSFRSMMK